MHRRALAISKLLLGADMMFDFDMLISKAPHSDTPVPWHQDQAYWLDMPDKRSVSCWVCGIWSHCLMPVHHLVLDRFGRCVC